VFYVTQLKK
jgi:hypothetical protein